MSNPCLRSHTRHPAFGSGLPQRSKMSTQYACLHRPLCFFGQLALQCVVAVQGARVCVPLTKCLAWPYAALRCPFRMTWSFFTYWWLVYCLTTLTGHQTLYTAEARNAAPLSIPRWWLTPTAVIIAGHSGFAARQGKSRGAGRCSPTAVQCCPCSVSHRSALTALINVLSMHLLTDSSSCNREIFSWHLAVSDGCHMLAFTSVQNCQQPVMLQLTGICLFCACGDTAAQESAPVVHLHTMR